MDRRNRLEILHGGVPFRVFKNSLQRGQCSLPSTLQVPRRPETAKVLAFSLRGPFWKHRLQQQCLREDNTVWNTRRLQIFAQNSTELCLSFLQESRKRASEGRRGVRSTESSRGSRFQTYLGPGGTSRQRSPVSQVGHSCLENQLAVLERLRLERAIAGWREVVSIRQGRRYALRTGETTG